MRYKTNGAERGQPDRLANGMAVGLGVFGIALGTIEVLFGGPLARALGLEGYEWIVPLFGIRQIVTGIFIFMSSDATGGIWLRVLGDILDIAAVAFGLSRHLAPGVNFVIAFVVLAGALGMDCYCAARLTHDSKRPLPGGMGGHLPGSA